MSAQDQPVSYTFGRNVLLATLVAVGMGHTVLFAVLAPLGRDIGLTEVQIAEIREIFTLFDKNSDGYVNTNELGTILRALHMNPTQAEVKDMEKDLDPNETGSFDQMNLISLIARRPKTDQTLE